MLPYPVETKKLKMTILLSADEVDLKLNIIGSSAKEVYDQNPYLDDLQLTYGKYIQDKDKDAHCPHFPIRAQQCAISGNLPLDRSSEYGIGSWSRNPSQSNSWNS